MGSKDYLKHSQFLLIDEAFLCQGHKVAYRTDEMKGRLGIGRYLTLVNIYLAINFKINWIADCNFVDDLCRTGKLSLLLISLIGGALILVN